MYRLYLLDILELIQLQTVDHAGLFVGAGFVGLHDDDFVVERDVSFKNYPDHFLSNPF